MATAAFDAIVLTGGGGTRLGGVSKADLEVAGTTLLRRTEVALSAARTRVVVGAEVTGGPVAAVAAGLRRVSAPVVVTLACDMPLVSQETVARLVAAVPAVSERDGAVLVDGRGRQQYLAAAYRRARLVEAVDTLEAAGPLEGQSMRRLLQGLRLQEVPAHSEEAMDCDTWLDVRRAVELLEGP